MAVMGLLPGNGKCKISGNIWYYDADGNKMDLLTLTEDQMRSYRGRHISMIFQEPMTSLNPVHTCGEQIIEVLQTHQKISYNEAYNKALLLMEEVLIPRPEKIMKSYPHQVSGGQKQRVMIAMALACNPDVLIADEPTTALDVTVQKTILELLGHLQQKYGMAIIFITHDLGVIANIAHDVAVLYKGEIVEHKPTGELFANPSHPYTKGLLACRPPLDSRPIRLYTVADYLGGNAVQGAKGKIHSVAQIVGGHLPLGAGHVIQVVFNGLHDAHGSFLLIYPTQYIPGSAKSQMFVVNTTKIKGNIWAKDG